MNKSSIIKLTSMAVAIVFVIAACKKTKITIPPAEAHFIGAKVQNYAVRNTTPPPYVITLGTTNVTNEDRTVTVSVTSSTGAVAGTQYTLNIGSNNTVTIPAGETRATFSIQGILAGFPAGRVDTLTITLSEPGVKPAGFDNSIKLALGDICAESDIIVSELAGDYANTNEVIYDGSGNPVSTWGPYLTKVKNVTSTGPTSAEITVENVYDFGWQDLKFVLNWSDINNRTVTIVDGGQYVGDAGTFSSSQAGNDLFAFPLAPGNTGTFSYCDNKIVLKFRVCIPTGCFNATIEETLER